MSDQIAAAKLEPHLASGSKLAGWRKGRNLAKSNKLDADLLSEVWEEKGRWWEVWLAPQTVRDRREWLRYRMSLVKTQTSLKNRIHALLHRHGIWHEQSDLFGKSGRAFLAGRHLCRMPPVAVWLAAALGSLPSGALSSATWR